MIAITEIQKSATFLIDVLSGELKLEEAVHPTTETASETEAVATE